MPRKQPKPEPKRRDLAGAVAVAAILSVAVSVGQMLYGQAVPNEPPEGGGYGSSGSSRSSNQGGCSGPGGCGYGASSEQEEEGNESSFPIVPPISSFGISSASVGVPPISSFGASSVNLSLPGGGTNPSSATVIVLPPSDQGNGGHGDDDSLDPREVYEREQERQQYRSDRGCFDDAGNWVTDRTLCASVDRQAGFIDARQPTDAPPVIRVGEGSPAVRAEQAETAFHEEMHLRFRGEELQAAQAELVARMDAAIIHLDAAREGITDDVASGRLADIASRIDALRVSFAGNVLLPAERESAEEELRLLLDEGLAVVQQAWQGQPESSADDRAELDAILAEFTFLVDAAPAVFELSEQYGVDVPDASYIAYVRLKAMLEEAAAECGNARCPLVPRMLDVLEHELQAPLLQAMQATMEPAEVSALIQRIEDMMTERRAGL